MNSDHLYCARHCRRAPLAALAVVAAGSAALGAVVVGALGLDRLHDLGCRLDRVSASARFVGADLATLRASVEGLRSALAEESVTRGHQITAERRERRKDLDRLAAETSAAIGLVISEQAAEASQIGRTGSELAALAGRVRALEARACRCGPPGDDEVTRGQGDRVTDARAPDASPCHLVPGSPGHPKTPPSKPGPAATPPAPSKATPAAVPPR